MTPTSRSVLRRTRRPWVLAALAAAVAITASACASPDTVAGAGARLGGSTLPIAEVSALTSEVSALADASGTPVATADVNRAQVSNWLQERLSDEAAKRAGITVTQGDIDRFLTATTRANGTTLEQFRTAAALQPGFWIAPSTLESYAKAFLQQRELGKAAGPNASPEEQRAVVLEAFDEVAADLGLDVSPRYGAWDAAQGSVGPAPNDLSAPADLRVPADDPLIVPDQS